MYYYQLQPKHFRRFNNIDRSVSSSHPRRDTILRPSYSLKDFYWQTTEYVLFEWFFFHVSIVKEDLFAAFF